MAYAVIPEHHNEPICLDLEEGSCYWCCETCNFAAHRCPGCGDDLDHQGRDKTGQLHHDCWKT